MTPEQLKAICKLAEHVQIDRVDEVYLGWRGLIPLMIGAINRAGDIRMLDRVAIFKLIRMDETDFEWWAMKDDLPSS